jgi:predicted phage-related endonuclease
MGQVVSDADEAVEHMFAQGSDEWHQFRRGHYGASEASAAIGISPYMTRDELIRYRATGEEKDVSDWVREHIFNGGHRKEKSARVIAEEIIGELLYPTTYSKGKLSASCDGITVIGETTFEHGLRNLERQSGTVYFQNITGRRCNRFCT